MQARSKIVEVSSTKFQVRKLEPDAGSFIFMRMMGISMRSAAEAEEKTPAKKANEGGEERVAQEVQKISGDLRVRALWFSVSSLGGMSFEEYQFIQRACMKVVSKMESREGVDLPMPIMSDAEEWTKAGEDVADDVGLIMKLTAEVLVFCFASFFDESVPGL